LLGAAGQFGIFGALILATLLGFKLNEAASIGVIGAIDGPTAIFVTSKLAPDLLGPIAVAAYSYMSLIPIIQPPIMKLMTTRQERLIRMEYAPRPVSNLVVVSFPVVVTVAVSLVAPAAAPLIAALMLGNLLREAGVVDRLSKAAQNEIINIATLFLGLAIGATMTADKFLFDPATGIQWRTLGIMALGLLAFILDTVAGLIFGKLMSFFSGGKINPLIGACGISAFPMAGRLSARAALEEDPDNFILMHAMGSNTAGQLGSVIAGGVLLAIVSKMLGIG
jgi:carboxybiotin decarboxylase